MWIEELIRPRVVWQRKAEGTEGEHAPKKEKLDDAEETATDEPMDDEEAVFNA